MTRIVRRKKLVTTEKSTTMTKVGDAATRLAHKLDALVDGVPESEFLPPWESVDEGDAERKAQVRALRSLVNSGTIAAACRSAGVTRSTFNRWMDTKEFKDAFTMATEEVADDLEEIAILRAKAGSDPLMTMMLKSYRPEKFGERKKVEVTGRDGEPIQMDVRVAGARAQVLQRIKALVAGSSGTEEVTAEVMQLPRPEEQK